MATFDCAIGHNLNHLKWVIIMDNGYQYFEKKSQKSS